MESNLSASRQARRFLDDRIRNDWEYPNVPPAWSASDEEVRDAIDFRERYYGESESGDSGTENDEDGTTSPYKFDSPDVVGDAVAQTRAKRKKRRRDRLELEMAENEGLRIWVHRRDIWTGAASVKKYGTERRTKTEPPPTATEDTLETVPHADANADLQSGPQRTPPETFDLVPVAPPLLESNPIRASITPKAYSDIFQKIVMSSRTPSVPINLADMSKALVQGWKDTDEWPPRATGAVLSPPSKKRASGGATTANGAHHGGFMERHPHLEKSVDSVKRILHMGVNGHHGGEGNDGSVEG